jgi:tetratricopeptide (TPR) repeat protein
MRDRHDSESGLGKFLKSLTTPIVAVTGFISSIYGFIKLFQDKDAGLVTIISVIVGILLLLGMCLYYARFWKPEKQDRARSAFEPPLSNEEVKAQGKKEKRRKWVRRSAVAGLILIPILCFSGYKRWEYVQSLPPKDILVLVAKFDGPDPQKYRVTKIIVKKLEEATEQYTDVKIQLLDESIDQSDAAKTEGKKRKASIVIWGWYGNTGEVIPLSVNFEVLRTLTDFPELGETAKGTLQQAAIAELVGADLPLQTRLSNEMSYLSLFTVGMVRYAARDLDNAIAAFTDALNQIKESTQVLDKSLVRFYLAGAYRERKDYDLALDNYNQALELNPDFNNVYVNRGLVYYEMDNYDRALEDYNQAIQTIKDKPSLAIAYNNRGIVYVAKQEYDRALTDFNQAFELEPKLAMGYNNRGLIYLNQGNYDRAIIEFNQALKFISNSKNSQNSNFNFKGNQSFNYQNPDAPLASGIVFDLSDSLLYLNRGTAYLYKGDYDRALTDFNQAIKLQPNSAPAYFNRATVYFWKEDYDQGIADSNQAIKLQPDFALAYLKRGSGYYLKNDYDRALTDFNQAIKLQPNSALSYDARGGIYYVQGDYDSAIADFDRALQLEPNNVEVYLQRASSYTKKGEYDRALADINLAFKLEPNNANAYNSRGWNYAQKGDYDRALTDVNQALKLKPNEPAFLDTRGYAYAGKGQYDRAISDYNQALKLKPDADYAYYHRGLAYRKKGNKDQAIADFKKTLELSKDPKKRQDAAKQLQEVRETI